jgi:conjugative relaxase-like TrwC/TraI family protein
MVKCNEEHFQRLANGQHPLTEEQLVRHQTAREYVNARGETVSTMEHRAAWDATFSAPKSVSLTALVGGDEAVRQAHRESAKVALGEMEKYVQARIGGNHPAETTGKWIAASFEHDSARPVNGYAAPQLHTHVVLFNLTETKDGEARALQPHQLYRSQQFATAIYRSELALRLKGSGYEIEKGKSSQPEIAGYTRDYLDASSPRSQQIQAYLEQQGLRGAGAAQIAAHQTRDGKLGTISHAEMQRLHMEMADRFGNQPAQVVRAAEAHKVEKVDPSMQVLESALNYARDKNLERREEQAHGKRPTAVRGCVPAPRFAGLAQWKCREHVPLRRVFDSLDQLQISMAGLAEWLRHWIVAPVTRVRFSHLAPDWAVRIRGLPTACTREMRARLSHRPPKFWLVNSTAECWSEEPVDTVQFRAEPPMIRV